MIYFLVIIYNFLLGLSVGWMSYGLVYGQMPVLGRGKSGGSNFSIYSSTNENPFLLEGFSARFTSLGLSLLIFTFGFLIFSKCFNIFDASYQSISLIQPLRLLLGLTCFFIAVPFGLRNRLKTIDFEMSTAKARGATFTGATYKGPVPTIENVNYSKDDLKNM